MPIPTRPDGTVPEWVQKRHDFAVRYCESKGWPTDPAELSLTQIMEIRGQSEWQDAAAGCGDSAGILVLE